MKKSERLVFFYDLAIGAESRTFKAPKPISVRKAFQLMELVPVEQRIKEMSKGREQLYVSEWKWDGDIISILVNKSDKGMSDPVFTIPKEKKRRTAEKQEKEGQDFSVHFVVQLPQNDLDPALVLIEYCAGLGMFVVQRLLNQILHDAKSIAPLDFEQNHPDGSVDDAGKPCWEGDDCVCQDAVYPVDYDDDRTSMPVYLSPQPAPKQEPHSLLMPPSSANVNDEKEIADLSRLPMMYQRDAYRMAKELADHLAVTPVQAQPDHIAIPGKMGQPLTFDQIEDIWTKHGLNECDCHGFARAIEQAHGIKVQP